MREQLAENGASDAEIAFMVNDRVELNAMSSDALVAMIERKLNAYGLEKVVPDDDTLAEAYRAFHRSRGLRRAYAAIEKAYDAKAKDVVDPEGPADERRARSSTSTATSDGTTRCGSCSTSAGSSVFERTRRRPGRKPATSPAQPSDSTATARKRRARNSATIRL